MNVLNSAGRSCMSASSRTLTTPRPSSVRRRKCVDLELRGAEERIGLLLLELDDLADDDAGGRRRDPAVLGHLGLALVGVQVVQQRPQVLEVDERQLLVVAVLEGERQDRLLRLVQVEDLGQQDRPESSTDARSRTPLPSRSSVRNSTGNAFGA